MTTLAWRRIIVVHDLADVAVQFYAAHVFATDPDVHVRWLEPRSFSLVLTTKRNCTFYRYGRQVKPSDRDVAFNAFATGS